MRSLNGAFVSQMTEPSRNTVVYVKIYNDLQTIYLTSNAQFTIPPTELNPEDSVLNGVIIEAVNASERIIPENGVSELGNATISLNESLFTEVLRDLYQNQETIYNNKVEIYEGDLELAFDDFELYQTLYVTSIKNTQTSYSINLSTVEVFTKAKIFPIVEAEVIDGWAIEDDLTEITMVEGSGDLFKLVEHDSEWVIDPDLTIGYFQIEGNDSKGEKTREVISYTSKSSLGGVTTFTGIERARFNTRLVAVIGSNQAEAENSAISVITEYKYLSLATGKMIWALMTGELYGQPGQRIPDHWCGNVDPTLIDLVELERIGLDLWNPSTDEGFHYNIKNLPSASLKVFVSREILRPSSLTFRTNQFGQLQAVRFTQVIGQGGHVITLNKSDVISAGGFDRNSKNIRNVFTYEWEWDAYLKKALRSQEVNDTESQLRNNVVTRGNTTVFKAIQNSNLSVADLLKTLTDGIRTRLANPAIMPKITASIRNTFGLQVMDVIKLDLKGWPDFTDTEDISRTFEIQSIKHSLLKGTCEMKLYGSTDKSSSLQDNIVTTFNAIDHTGWDNIADVLVRQDAGNSSPTHEIDGNILRLLQDCHLTSAVPDFSVDLEVMYYYFDGTLDLDGFELTFQKHSVIHVEDANLADSTLTGAGRGTKGGQGVQSTTDDNTLVLGQQGVIGGEDNAVNNMVTPRNFITGSWIDNGFFGNLRNNTIEAHSSIPPLIAIIDENEKLRDVYFMAGFAGSGGGGTHNEGFISPEEFFKGGDGGNGGAGLTFIANNIVTNINTLIDTSGDDGLEGELGNISHPTVPDQDVYFTGGSGGGGWPGVIDVYQLDITAPKFINIGVYKSERGALPDPLVVYPLPIQPEIICPGKRNGTQVLNNRARDAQGLIPGELTEDYMVNAKAGYTRGSSFVEGEVITPDVYTRIEMFNAMLRISYLPVAPLADEISGVDDIAPPNAPLTLELEELINTPNAPLGQISTITAIATPPANISNFSYVAYTYKVTSLENQEWYSLDYTTEQISSFPTLADGREILVRARSIGKDGSEGGVIQETITVKNVLTEPAVETTVLIPRLTGLQIKNRVNLKNFEDFKSGSCELKWNASSNSANVPFGDDSLLGADAGAYDPYFRGYLVRIYPLVGTNIIREASTTTEEFIYTLDMNRRDSAGRSFRCAVFARGDNNQVGEGTIIVANNPQPEAPTGIVVTYTRENTIINYTPPINDVDYVGVKVDDDVFTGSSITLPYLSVRNKTIVLTSVDEFGDGLSVNVELENPAPNPPILTSASTSYNSFKINFIEPTNDFDYLGVRYRYKLSTNPTFGSWVLARDSFAFVQGLQLGVEYDVELESIDPIGSSATVEISVTTQQLNVSDLGPIVDPVIIDEVNGRLITNNSGYISVMGIHDEVDNPSANPLAFSLYDSNSSIYPFWLDVAGNVSFGFGDNGIVFDGFTMTLGDNVTIGSNENRTITVGALGDYLNINDAISALSRVVPSYKNGGFTATILLLTGFIITEKVSINGLNLGWVTITSVDPIVMFNLDGIPNPWFLEARNGSIAPRIEMFIELVNGAVGQGYLLVDSSILFDENGTGVPTPAGVDCDSIAISGLNSSITIRGSEFNNCNTAVAANICEVLIQNTTFNNTQIGLNSELCKISAAFLNYVNVTTCITSDTGMVKANGCDFGGGDVVSRQGANLNASDSNNANYSVIEGGTIIATNTTGSTYNIATNTFTASGTIYV